MTIAVGESERSELKAAMARALAHPVPWEVLKRRIMEQDGNTAYVKGTPLAREPAEFIDLPLQILAWGLGGLVGLLFVLNAIALAIQA